MKKFRHISIGWKVSIGKSGGLLYSNTELSEKECRKIIQIEVFKTKST
jgi:hypothetical protein